MNRRKRQFFKKGARAMMFALAIAAVFLAVTVTTGCSSRSSVQEKTTEYSRFLSEPPAQRTVVKEEKTVREEGEQRGVISTVWHFVGKVLAFPFRLAADVIEFVF